MPSDIRTMKKAILGSALAKWKQGTDGLRCDFGTVVNVVNFSDSMKASTSASNTAWQVVSRLIEPVSLKKIKYLVTFANGKIEFYDAEARPVESDVHKFYTLCGEPIGAMKLYEVPAEYEIDRLSRRLGFTEDKAKLVDWLREAATRLEAKLPKPKKATKAKPKKRGVLPDSVLDD